MAGGRPTPKRTRSGAVKKKEKTTDQGQGEEEEATPNTTSRSSVSTPRAAAARGRAAAAIDSKKKASSPSKSKKAEGLVATTTPVEPWWLECPWWMEWLYFRSTAETQKAWVDILEGKAPVVACLATATTTTASAATAAAATAAATAEGTTTTTTPSPAAASESNNNDDDAKTPSMETLWGHTLFLWTHCLQRLLLEMDHSTAAGPSSASSPSLVRTPWTGDQQQHQHLAQLWTLAYLALGVAKFVSQQHSPQPHNTPKNPHASSRPLIARAVVVATMAALRALHDCATAPTTTTTASSSTPTTASANENVEDEEDDSDASAPLMRFQTVLAGAEALRLLVTWQQQGPATSSSAATSATSTSIATTEEDEAAAVDEYWDLLDGRLKQLQRPNSRSLQRLLRTAVSSIDWSNEIAFWNAISNPFTANHPPSSPPVVAAATTTTTPAAANLASVAPPALARTIAGRAARTVRGKKSPPPPPVPPLPVPTKPASTTPSVVDSLLALLSQNPVHAIAVDGRLAPKRWASAALVWFLQGQVQLVQVIRKLLDNSHADDWYLDLNGSAPDLPNDHNDDHDTTNGSPFRIGLAALLMEVLHKAATGAGSRPPSGGIEGYVKAFGIKRKKADIRGLATVALFDLVARHAESFERDPSSVYPFLTKAVQDLARAVGASPGDRDFTRLECAAAAFGLHLRIAEPKFLAFCLQKLDGSLRLHGGAAYPSRMKAFQLPALTPTNKKANSFAGVYDDGSTTLHLFLRAMQPNSCEAILSFVLETADRCLGAKNAPAPKGNARRKKQKKEECAMRPLDRATMSLASDALDCLEACLQQGSHGTLTIRSVLGKGLRMNHMPKLIALGFDSTSLLQRARGAFDQTKATLVVEFHPEEKRLWDAYTNVCLCLGRGQISYRADRAEVLGSNRLDVYKRIVEHELMVGHTTSFPLWFSYPHRRLLAANLAAESLQDSKADKFLVDGVIAAISEALSSVRTRLRPLPQNPISLSLEECIPLSLNYSRLFCLAMVRLGGNDGISAFNSLLSVVHSGLHSLEKEGLDALAASDEYGSFVARVIATCTSLAVALTCNQGLQNKLYGIVGNAQAVYGAKATGERVERMFSSVFDNSICSELEASDFAVSTMSQDLSERLQSILEIAFAYGFESASADGCYLLHAAWVSLGKSDLWRSAVVSSISTHNSLPSSLSALVLELRDELCYMNRLMCQVDRRVQGSSFQRAIDQKFGESRSFTRKALVEKVGKELKAMVNKAEKICIDLLHHAECKNSDTSPLRLSQMYCLLEAVPAYLTFALSCLTRADQSYFAHLRTQYENRDRKRKRSYSSDSETYSDDESIESRDAVTDAVDRLQNVCGALGAVPSHPDWLDEECRLLEGLPRKEATSMVVSALEILAKISCAAADFEFDAKVQSIPSRKEKAELAVDLIKLHLMRCSLSASELTVADVASSISVITGTGTKGIESLIKFVGEAKRHRVHQRWFQWEAQRCQGSLNEAIGSSMTEDPNACGLRGGYEWERLYARSLTSCGPSVEFEAGDDELVTRAIDSAVRWHRVFQSAVDAMVPASALLRFCLSSKGRKAHPLKSIETSLDPSADRLSDVPLDLSPSDDSKAASSATKILLAIVSYFASEAGASCEAVALNLLRHSSSFAHIRDVAESKLALSTLSALTRHAASATATDDTVKEGLSLLFKAISHILQPERANSSRVFKAASDLESPSMGTIAAPETRLQDFFLAWSPRSVTSNWSQSMVIDALVACTWTDSLYVSGSTRVRFLQTLCGALDVDTYPISVEQTAALVHLSSSMNSIPDDAFRATVENGICRADSERDPKLGPGPRPFLVSLLTNVLYVQGPSAFVRPELVLNVIDRNVTTWIALDQPSQLSVLSLLLLYASRCCELHNTVSKLLRIDTKRSRTLENLALVGTFLRELLDPATESLSSATPRTATYEQPKARASLLQPACTHVLHSGFVDQHWYHCLTCGLTGDKGCCTLCALICHKNHEVCYSRFSAFFCDCGAEGGASNASRNFVCQCLSSLPQEAVDEAVATGRDEKGSALLTLSSSALDPLEPLQSENFREGLQSIMRCVSIARSSFQHESSESLKLVTKQGRGENWPQKILMTVASEFLACKEVACFPTGVYEDVSSYDVLRQSLLQRTTPSPLTFGGRDESLCLVSAFRTGSFQAKISSESSVDSLKRAMVSTSGARRAAIAIDSRARTIVVESSTLHFCSFLPIVSRASSTSPSKPMESECQRVSASLIGSCLLGFNVVGIQICDELEDRVVIWGTHEAWVGCMNEIRNGIERLIELDLGLGNFESGAGVVIDCGWLPGRASCLYVCCSRSLLVFDLRTGSTLTPVSAAVKFSANATIRGFVIVGSGSIPGSTWNAYVLLENGHLHDVHLCSDGDGTLSFSDVNLDPKQSLKLPMTNSNDVASTFVLTLGEGIHLGWLSQSKLLLYQAVGEGVLALLLDTAGSIVFSFPMLPKSVSNVGEPGKTAVTGPFTNWTDLGAGYLNGKSCFRACCVGRRNAKEQVLLLVNFNETETTVSELSWHGTGYNFGSAPTIEGLAAFSCPLITTDNDSSISSASTRPRFEERIFLVAYLSNGSIHIVGESTGTSLDTDGSQFHVRVPESLALLAPLSGTASDKVPLLAFEGLTNAMETDELVFQGCGIGSSDDVRKKLLRDNDCYLVSPSIEGLTLAISLKPRQTQRCQDLPILVAFKFLVGAASLAAIPRKVNVQGRDLDLLPDTKKWYSVILNQQEVAHGLRNGFTTFRISETHERSSNPTIDALECYVCNFSSVASWIPSTMESVVPCTSRCNVQPDERTTEKFQQRKNLFFSLQSLAQFCWALRPLGALEESSITILRRLLQDTALERNLGIADLVDSILESHGWGAEDRESFCDKSSLEGCSKFLVKCRAALDGSSTWQPILRSCLRSAMQLAARRPLNFQALLESETSPCSHASPFIIETLQTPNMNPDLIADFVELCLVELTAGSHSETVKGNVEAIRRVLQCSNENIVALACSKIAGFCERYHTRADGSVGDIHDPFAARHMVVLYRCDGCGLFPIKQTRYSSLADHRAVDLCQSCFKTANDYAIRHSYSTARPVLVEERTVGGDDNLTCSEIKLMQAVAIHGDKNQGETVQRQQLFDDFLEGLFSLVLDLMAESDFSNQLLGGLALVIVHYSGAAIDRAKRFAKELIRNLSRALSETKPPIRTIEWILHALVRLVVWDEGAACCLDGSEGGEENAEAEPDEVRPKCTTHGITASRRALSSGPQKGRVFFSCGKEFKSQCKFFAWATESASGHLQFNDSVAKYIWDEFPDLSDSLCRWVSEHFKSSYVDAKVDVAPPLSADARAGGILSRRRLHDVPTRELLQPSDLPIRTALGCDESVFNASLQLLALVAGPKGNASKAWSSLLCRVICAKPSSENSPPMLRAKRALLQLCGTKSRYVTVRAHFAFAKSRERIAAILCFLVRECMILREKARQSGPHWKDERCEDVSALRPGDLLGSEDLISEDILTSRRIDDARKTLLELAAVVKKRPDHWAKFCDGSIGLEVPVDSMPLYDLQMASPATFIFTVACMLRGESQAKAFRLIDTALAASDRKESLAKASAAYPPPVLAFELSVSEAAGFVMRFGCNGGTSETRQIACSIISRIFNELDRSLAGRLFQRLLGAPVCRTHVLGRCNADLFVLLRSLLMRAGSDHVNVTDCAPRIAMCWKQQMRAIRSTSTLLARRYDLAPCAHCMQSVLLRRSDRKSTTTAPSTGMSSSAAIEVSGSSSVKGWLPEQVTYFSRGRLEGWRDSTVSDEFNSFCSFKYRLVLSEFHCEVSDPRGRFVKTISFFFSPRPVSDVAHLKAPDYEDKWQPCGSITLAKGATVGSCKLEKPVVASNLRVEYTSFYERPGTSKSSDGSFVVHCPRCTRVVTNAHGVCGNCGEVCFQCRKCRHINYDRLDAFLCTECGYCASGAFAFELTAAIASNAVAIQNDADCEQACRMLGVAARLHQDLRSTLRDTVAVALGERDQPFYGGGGGTISSLSSPQVSSVTAAALRRALNGMLPLAPGELAENDNEAWSGPLTLNKLGKQGSVVKAVARSDSVSLMFGGNSGSRSQSLMRLTREWRESALAGSRRSGAGGGGGGSGDFILHHLSRDMDEEESNEVFGLLEGRSSDDPLSRLLASMQSRRERRTAAAAASSSSSGPGSSPAPGSGGATGSAVAATTNQPKDSGAGSGSGSTSAAPTLTKEVQELCDRLYLLMREAEREAYHLQLRVDAWRRLESGSLIEYGCDDNGEDMEEEREADRLGEDDPNDAHVDRTNAAVHHFEPTQCSACSGPVALHLLNLWLALLKLQPDCVEVSHDMIHRLLGLQEPLPHSGGWPAAAATSLNKGWHDVQVRALTEIAVHSPHGSSLVLDALRLRLQVSPNPVYSEILGSIIEEGGSDAFVALAHDVLQASFDADEF